MNDTPNENERRIIPRWRNSQTTQKTREVSSINEVNKEDEGKNFILAKKENWKIKKSLINAVELVTSAFCQDSNTEAIDAAEFIIAIKENILPAVTEIATKVLISSGRINQQINNNKAEFINNPTELFNRIHVIRNLLSKYPRNALMWADLSQAYTNIGSVDQAIGAMQTAIFLAPDNRFILRSATRLFIHFDIPDRANRLLLSREITIRDPWLLSAEIATATVEGKTSRLIKYGKEIIQNERFRPFHVSELASALGTVELNNGAIKKAKKLFQISLIDPNENSVAQSIWAQRNINSLDISIAFQKTPNIFEALARKAYFDLDWDLLISASKSWLKDEPFSSRPAELGSFAASDGKKDYLLGETFCRNGLIANPLDLSLLNNLAFSLVNQEKIEEAEIEFEKSRNIPTSEPVEIALKATEGLICFRKGDYQKGQELYLDAMRLAEKKHLEDYKNRAAIYYAIEMMSGRND